MTPARAQQLLDCITYKQDWLLSIGYDNEWAYIFVQCTPSLDSDNPVSGTLERPYVKHYFELGNLDDQGFIETVKVSVARLELHEMDEWLRYKGERVTTPQH